MGHPQNYWHHNQAYQEYLNQLKKIQREIDIAIDLSRGTYFDEDSIGIKKSNTQFRRFQPYRSDERTGTSTDTREYYLIDQKIRLGQLIPHNPAEDSVRRRYIETVNKIIIGDITYDEAVILMKDDYHAPYRLKNLLSGDFLNT